MEMAQAYFRKVDKNDRCVTRCEGLKVAALHDETRKVGIPAI
jgi:hypothetical protein